MVYESLNALQAEEMAETLSSPVAREGYRPLVLMKSTKHRRTKRRVVTPPPAVPLEEIIQATMPHGPVPSFRSASSYTLIPRSRKYFFPSLIPALPIAQLRYP